MKHAKAAARHLSMIPVVILMVVIEAFFLVFHFCCGTLSIGFGLFGYCFEATLKKLVPRIYD
jgi:hypothetical protein